MNYSKVSLLVPCYNMASVCDRFFESLLSQTYDNLEIICVNDGSTDSTEQKLLFYKEKLENRGYEVKYIFQENRGLGGAINTALKYFTGDYLCWADPDDYFEENSFEVRVKYMENNPNCAVVTSDAYIRDGNKVSLASDGFSSNKNMNQFELLIKKESVFCSGCHMVRTSAFDLVNPEREIFEYRRGQNWQLLLPVYYAFERAFLDVPLYDYIVYSDSMSHIKETYEQKKERIKEHQNVIFKTIEQMHIDDGEKNKWYKKIEIIYSKFLLDLAYTYGRKKDYYFNFKSLLGSQSLKLKDFLKFLIMFVKNDTDK